MHRSQLFVCASWTVNIFYSLRRHPWDTPPIRCYHLVSTDSIASLSRDGLVLLFLFQLPNGALRLASIPPPVRLRSVLSSCTAAKNIAAVVL